LDRRCAKDHKLVTLKEMIFMANPKSRNEEILQSIVDDTEYSKVPQSREEYLLLEIKDIIEQGGGGGTSNVQGLVLTMNTSTYVITAYLVDGEGQQVGDAQTVDIPLEATIVDASYNNTTKVITFTLTSGAYLSVPIGDIIYGLQPLIDSNHKLSSSLVDDTQGRMRFTWVGTTAQWAIDGPNVAAGTPYIITDDDYTAPCYFDGATGELYVNGVKILAVMDEESYEALETKSNIWYATYPTPTVNANLNSQRSESPVIEDEMWTALEDEPIEELPETPSDDDMR
jgi:hypothetical protein